MQHDKIAYNLFMRIALCLTMLIAAFALWSFTHPQQAQAADKEISRVLISDVTAPAPGSKCNPISGYKVEVFLMGDSKSYSPEGIVDISGEWGYGIGYGYKTDVTAVSGRKYFANFTIKPAEGYKWRSDSKPVFGLEGESVAFLWGTNSDKLWRFQHTGDVYTIWTTEMYEVGNSTQTSGGSQGSTTQDATIQEGATTGNDTQAGTTQGGATQAGTTQTGATQAGTTQTDTTQTNSSKAPVAKATAISKLKAAKKSFTINVKKIAKSKATGYQYRYATSKASLSKAKAKKLSSSYSKTSIKVKNLNAKKKYYVQVRTYKKSGSKTAYSAWSKVVTVKTK